MPYDPEPYILPRPYLPGGLIWCEVTWHPAHDSPRGVLGAYTVPTGGHVSLIPGVVAVIVADLGLPPVEQHHAARLAALVNRQLATRPHAEVVCPAGRAEVVLHPRRG